MRMQSIIDIPIKDLVLWTENPRDAINAHANNDTIITRALRDGDGKWRLRKLAKEMGEFYDYSLLPTVVKKGKKYVVYDGNRRVILAKLANDCYSGKERHSFKLPSCESTIPCCVADEDTAIKSVFRKHSDSGSWDYLSREVFLSKFLKQPKSAILQLDEMLDGEISNSHILNKRFVGEEVIVNSRLKPLGIQIESGNLKSRHSASSTRNLVDAVLCLVEEGELSTRRNRTKPLSELLPKSLLAVVEKDKNKPYKKLVITKARCAKNNAVSQNIRLTKRVAEAGFILFGRKLCLRAGDVSNLYRDIVDLYDYYIKQKETLSDRFPVLIRMALRLLCELASGGNDSKAMNRWVSSNFNSAKAKLSTDKKNFLYSNSVTLENVISLLHIGAHNYSACGSLDQTIAMSLIIGEMLSLTYGKSK